MSRGEVGVLEAILGLDTKGWLGEEELNTMLGGNLTSDDLDAQEEQS